MANPAYSSSSPLFPPPNPAPAHYAYSSNPPSPRLKPTSNPNSATTSSPLKKNQPLPWTHQETINLIQAYQEKWYSLKKGQLKASQWEEVSVTVAARCGYDEPSKSATQCRHKIEKLRKRYRAERVKRYANSWQYFEFMDSMERGPLPIAAHPMAVVKYQNSNYDGDYTGSDSDERDVKYGSVDVRKSKLKSINNILRANLGLSSNGNRNAGRMTMDGNFGDCGGRNARILRALREPVSKKRKGYFENAESDEDDGGHDEGEQEEEEEGEEKQGNGGKELAAEIRGFAEGFMRMENKKIEMMRETERYRMEMEKRRTEMILESQRKIADTIGKAFGVHKKVKMTQEI